MILKLKNQLDVEHAIQLVSWLNRPSIDKVLVLLPWLEAKERHQLAKTLKHLFNDCGCLWAGSSFLLTFASYFLINLLKSKFSWTILTTSFGIGIGMALVAKFLALGWSYWRLKHLFSSMMLPASQEESIKLIGGRK